MRSRSPRRRKSRREVRRLLGVFDVRTAIFPLVTPLTLKGRQLDVPNLSFVSSVDGLYFNQDATTAVAGRTANPKSAHEFVTTPKGARLAGWHVGETVKFAVYNPADVGTAVRLGRPPMS